MKLHIFVATTQGLVAIQNITAIDDADISSIVSINGTSTTANISSAYHNFVKKGAGIIQQDFGACSYRINISDRIDHGNSWQLAFYLAHAAKNDNILGDGQVSAGDQVICATGEVNTSNRNIQGISEISLKQQLAAKQIKQWHKNNNKVCFLVPEANRQDLDKQLPLNIKLVSSLAQALCYLPLTASANTSNVELENTSASLIKTVSNSYWYQKKLTLIISALLMSFFMLLLFSMNVWFSTDNKPTRDSKNSINHNYAQQTWQVILLKKPEHEINETLRPAYALIEKTITEQLIAENFDVADITLLTGTKQLTEQTLFQLSKEQVNLAIRFNLTVHKLNQLTNTSADTWRFELSADLIDLATKKIIENHSEYSEYSNNFRHCDKQCIGHWFANNAKKLAQDMGAILVVKLKNLPRQYQFELIFQDFLAKELVLIHKQLKSINGFLSSKLLQQFDNKSELFHQTSSRKYLYNTYLPTGELDIELHQVFAQLGLPVANVKHNTKTLIFIRANMPYSFYYVVASIILITFLIFMVFLQRKGHFTFAQHNDVKKLAVNLNTEGAKLTNSIAFDENITPIQGAVIGQGALANCYIFTAGTLALGRLAIEPSTSFSIGYQQISRVGKQCLFSYQNNNFYLEEQGSTNGSIFNGIKLAAQQKVNINQASQLILGGANKGEIALCQLDIKVTVKECSALIMQLNNKGHEFINLDKTKLAWPSMAKDLSSRWVLLAKELSLSIDNGQIILGSDKKDTIAYLVYQNGFYIRPAQPARGNVQIMINQKVIDNIMPITENAVISLNGYEFSLQG
ncbi:FHA domain-containing protein [Colwellia sp. TT2012]|uniref:FHA domain-containing protein n=1 Tax=Colwellia sp. TT2012 TaxID=1720342 RepID=UPI00070EA1AC|nr:FHA domain-containing protein [Colwellia sp. TT2012]